MDDQSYYPESGDDFFWDPLDEPINYDEWDRPLYPDEEYLARELAFDRAWNKRRWKEKQKEKRKDIVYGLLFWAIFLLIATSSSWCRLGPY